MDRFLSSLPLATVEPGSSTETSTELLGRRTFAVALGAVVTPAVILSFALARNVLITYLVGVFVWLLVPTVLRLVSTRARNSMVIGWKRSTRDLKRQLAVGVPGALVLTGAVFSVYVFTTVVADDSAIESTRRRFYDYGLAVGTTSERSATIFVFVWLTVSNPILEELFWRAFLYRSLLEDPDTELSWRHDGWAWWGPAAVSAVLYASYHVVLINEFTHVGIAFAAGVVIIGYGIVCQLLTAQFGLIASIVVHAGGDFGAALGGADLLFGWGVAPVPSNTTI